MVTTQPRAKERATPASAPSSRGFRVSYRPKYMPLLKENNTLEKKYVYKANFSDVLDQDPDGSGFFSPIRIGVIKVRIRPFINFCDIHDGFDKVLELTKQ